MNRIILFCLLALWTCHETAGQTSGSRMSGVSTPEKWWAVWHPFKAKRALEISLTTLKITDSVGSTGAIGKDINGGHLDAFKHCYWMYALSGEIGASAALKLGRAHEKGNFRSYKKGQLEDGHLPDAPASEMDLHNNKIGASLAREEPVSEEARRVKRVIEALKAGELMVLKKKGSDFLTCEGRVIPRDSLRGKWYNEKCLVPSDQRSN